MKKLIPLLLLVSTGLSAEPVLYEGFNAEGPDAGGRTGFLSTWHRHAGEVGSITRGIGIRGFAEEKGALLLENKGEALAQAAVDVSGTYYGSFRVHTAELRNESLLGLLFAKPDLENLTPKTANLSLLIKGWRLEYGVVNSRGRSFKATEGAPIEAEKTYLVLFKVENPETGPSVADMWILNQAQALNFRASSMSERMLNSAALGNDESSVMQRIRLEAKKGTKLEIKKGDLVVCVAKFNSKAAFDEIRLSKKSLADASGVSGEAETVTPAPVVKPALPKMARSSDFSKDQPDIVFVLLDDLRWDAMSFLDHPYVETPQIDKLRAQGAWMQNTFVTTSICCPSRATFLTGTYASRHGVIDNETSEYNPEITPPVSKYLQEAGYKTAMIGKWHMGYSGKPRAYFDEWLSFDGQGKYYDPEFIYTDGSREKLSGYTTDILTDRAIDFVNRQPGEQPFFLMLSHKAVHEPFKPAPRHKTAFGAGTMDPEPVSWSGTFEGKPEWQRRQRTRDVRWNWRTRDVEEEKLPDAIALEPWKESKKYVDQLRCLAAVDDGVGRLVEALRERGNLENTLIIFTSDNGYFHMEHRRWDKRLAYEESLRIPMIVVYPGKIEAGSTISEMVSNVDFAPTILNYAGIPMPDHMQGASMQPLFEGDASNWRESVFYEYWTDLVHSIPTMKAVRTDRYKLIAYPELDDIDELYDLKRDPHEMNNLVQDPEYAGVLDKMERLLAAEAERVGWSVDVFPKNLPRVRGPKGTLFDLQIASGKVKDSIKQSRPMKTGKIVVDDGMMIFNGKGSRLEVPFDPDMDPSVWPYRIAVDLRPEEGNGVVAAQSSPGYGFKLFIEDGRPGIAVLCKTWIRSRTIIDGPEVEMGQWVKLEAEIDYNRVSFWMNGELIDTMTLPLPFKAKTKAPLLVGAGGSNKVSDEVPNNYFKGQIRGLTVRRPVSQ
ncbi:MAG: sulfatase-like hydrolase/transferase [Verrucomicrobiota bacterium]